MTHLMRHLRNILIFVALINSVCFAATNFCIEYGSEAPVECIDSISGSINWDAIEDMIGDQQINWDSVEQIADTNINWTDFNIPSGPTYDSKDFCLQDGTNCPAGGSGDMTKAEYDSEDNGLVDWAEGVNAAGINWTSFENIPESGINWIDAFVPDTSINWGDQVPLNEDDPVWNAEKSSYAPIDSPTITTKMTLNYATASELVATNASKELVSLAVATYPSLAELAYVKGVTSAIQTQITAKGAHAGQVWTGTHDFGGADDLEIPNGAPTVDTAGQVGLDTTSDQLIYYGGAKRVLTYRYTTCRTLETPVDADDNIPVWAFPQPITITDVHCYTEGGTSIAVTISDGTNALEAVTCDADGADDDGSIANGTFTANENIEWDFAAPTGTVDWVKVCITYEITAD